MTTTPTTWRDLAAELSAEQVDNLTGIERDLEQAAPAAQVAEAMLDIARDCVQYRLVDAALADVAAPVGPQVGDWERLSDGGYRRYLSWSERPVGAAMVAVDGGQGQDGSVTRAVSLYTNDGAELPAVEARRLAAALMAAADELDRLDGQQPVGPVVPVADVVAALTALRAEIRAEAEVEADATIGLMRSSEGAGVLRALGAVELLGDRVVRG